MIDIASAGYNVMFILSHLTNQGTVHVVIRLQCFYVYL